MVCGLATVALIRIEVMLEEALRTLIIHAIVKGYHDCNFEVELEDKKTSSR